MQHLLRRLHDITALTWYLSFVLAHLSAASEHVLMFELVVGEELGYRGREKLVKNVEFHLEKIKIKSY